MLSPSALSAVTSNDYFRILPSKYAEMLERKTISIFQELGGTPGIANDLNTSLTQGISDMGRRVEVHGRNELPPPPPISLLKLIWDALKDPMIRLLIVASILSIIFGMVLPDPKTNKVNRESGWIEGTAILISVTVVVSLSAVNDWRKAKKFEELEKEQSVKEVDVIRNGKKVSIDSKEVVVGDLLLVFAGQTLVADGVFVEGQDLKADESAATGESDIQKKDSSDDPFFLSGTNITEGEGRVLVIAVGVNSFNGRLTIATRTEMAETPLQIKLAGLADVVGKLGLCIALCLFLILSIKQVVYIVRDNRKFNIVNFLNYIIISVTVVVVAIPEGLPLAVTIALAYSMRAMMMDNCLVRVLAACETMGAATAICSDKTGTLTKNKMTVVQGWVGGENFIIQGYGIIPKEGLETTTINSSKPALQKTSAQTLNSLYLAISVNSTAEERETDGKLIWIGNKTEFGLLGFVKFMGKDYSQLRSSITRSDKISFPFSSLKKRMTTAIRTSAGVTVFVKGASELVLADCNRYVDVDGKVKELVPSKKNEMLEIILYMARQGNRTIGFGYEEYPGSTQLPQDEPSIPLIFSAVFGIQDPIREEVPDAVLTCQNAGVTIRMVTGDNIETAMAIATKCNIFDPKHMHIAMEGIEFREMAKERPEETLQMLPRLRVLARSSPTDKHVLVGLLMQMGDVVGVTGDGTNDAPALKLANVGFAMQTGSEVAKGASSMVLLDDNFATVVKAITWGRTVNDNIRKFLQFQVTANVCGVVMTVVGAVVSEDNEEPLKPVQLLWLNLIMDTFAALGLATEKPNKKCLERDPVFKTSPLISNRMRLFILGSAAFELAIIFSVMYTGHRWFNIKEDNCGGDGKEGHQDGDYCRNNIVHSTIVFNVFIFLQIFNEFNARKLYAELNVFEGLISRSRPFLFVMLIVIPCQIFAVEVAGKFMHTTNLSIAQWFGCLGLAILILPYGLALRTIPVPSYRPPKQAILEVDKAKQINEALSALGQWRAITDQVIIKNRVVRKFKVAFRRRDPALARLSESERKKIEELHEQTDGEVPLQPVGQRRTLTSRAVSLKDVKENTRSPPATTTNKTNSNRSLKQKSSFCSNKSIIDGHHMDLINGINVFRQELSRLQEEQRVDMMWLRKELERTLDFNNKVRNEIIEIREIIARPPSEPPGSITPNDLNERTPMFGEMMQMLERAYQADNDGTMRERALRLRAEQQIHEYRNETTERLLALEQEHHRLTQQLQISQAERERLWNENLENTVRLRHSQEEADRLTRSAFEYETLSSKVKELEGLIGVRSGPSLPDATYLWGSFGGGGWSPKRNR